MDAKLISIALLLVIGITSMVDSAPTCAERTCGGTREVAGAPPAEGEGEGEGEEEEKDPCETAPLAWKNHFSWYTFCKDGSIGATKNPIGKIGAPTEAPEEGAEEK